MTYMQHTPQNGASQAANRAPRLPRNPNSAMQEMMNTIDHIRGVYQRETDILEVADMQSFIAIQDEKFQAAELYQSDVTEIMSRKDEMKKADPVLKSQLEAMQKDFVALTQKNMEALERMRRIMDRLGGKIREAVRDEAQKQRAVSYGESGHLDHDERKAISTGISETA